MAKKKSQNPAKPAKAPAKAIKATKAEIADQRKKLVAKIEQQDATLLKQLNKRAEDAAKLIALDGQSSCSADAKQIEALLKRNAGPLPVESVRGVFRELMSGCRRISRETQVSYLGPEFSYSYLAALERFGQNADLVAVGTIAAAFEEVVEGNSDFGIVPLENSTDGRIVDTFHMFAQAQLRICGEVRLKIHHNLLGKGPRSKVKKVCSKPQALSQCRRWLNEHFPNAEWVATSSTTAAAELAAKDPSIAAVASRQAGVNNGLEVLAANIEDNPENVTRFAVLGNETGARTGNDKTALYFQVLHSAGALADVLMIFKRNKLNMTWIESFPLPGKPSEYFFFAEVQGHEKDLKVRKALALLEKKTHVLKVLGSYAATEPIG